ncbi:MAG TPA: mycothione reductase [Dermatophilaceae bacterium]|nr:mycothione reductase [Dermatophilaceae bacterium]
MSADKPDSFAPVRSAPSVTSGGGKPESVEHFDLVVVGSGSGNSLVTADFEGKRVAIVERGTFGGTCLNVGCIPTKMFVYAADVATTARDSARYGIDAQVLGVRWPDIRDRVFGRIDPISQAGLSYRSAGPDTTAVLGSARFVGDRRLAVDLLNGGTQLLQGEQVVLAAGSAPRIPPSISASGVPYHTSDTVMRVPELPQRVVIVGGGYIACEFAHLMSALGSSVTLVVRGDALLRHLDGDISRRFTAVGERRWDVRLRAEVCTLGGSGTEPADIQIGLDDGSSLVADLLLVATGRSPNTDDLELPTGGVAVHPDGRVAVDRYGRTTAPGVWALGDVCSPFQLKHVANHESRVVAHNLTHPGDLRKFRYEAVPAAVFSHPQVATVGLTEEELQAAGRAYLSATQRYADTAYGWAMEDTQGVCKVLADPTSGLLLGAHIVGPQASVIIQPAVQAMATGQRALDVARDQYWIHPALTEVLENALLGLHRD